MSADPLDERRSDPRAGTLFRAGMALAAVGALSASSVRHALDDRADVAFALGFATALALVLLASPRKPPRYGAIVAFTLVAATYLAPAFGAGGNPLGMSLHVVAMSLAFLAAAPPFRSLAVAAFALWTPALRFFGPDPLGTGFPAFLAPASLLSLGFVVAALLLRDAGPRDQLRRVALALLSVAIVSTVVERHLVVASLGLAPDDLLALVASVALPVLAFVPFARAREVHAESLAVGLVLSTYVLVGVALIVGKPYHSDAVAIVHRASQLALAGADPYVAIDVPDALARFGLPASLATHLEDGSIVGALNYPALSFLIPAPFVALGLADLRVLYLVELVALALLAMSRSGWGWRTLAVAAVVGNVVNTRQNLLAGVDPAWALLVAAAYLFVGRRWISPIALGLAAATRQPAWFFVPFYLVVVLRDAGYRATLRRGVVVLAAFALPNLPYVIASPSAFAAGVTGPFVAPFEPYGVGFVRLGIDGVIPLLPRGAYAALAAAAFFGLLGLLWWRWRDIANGALSFPPVPIYFAWRSLQNYFAFAPLFAMLGDEELLREISPTPHAVLSRESLEVPHAGRQGAAGDPGVPGGQVSRP